MLAISTVIPDLFASLDALLNQYINNSYTRLVEYLRTPLALSCTLYICGLGFLISQGHTKLRFDTFIYASIKISAIYALAMHWDLFNQYILHLFQNVIYELANHLIQSGPDDISTSGQLGFSSALQKLLLGVMKQGVLAWVHGSWHNISPFFTAICSWAFGFVLILTALYHLVTALIMTSLLLGLAPLFISMALFSATQGIFIHWLERLTVYALVNLLVTLGLGLVMNIMTSSLNTDTGTIHVLSFVPLMIVSSVSIGVVQQAVAVAHEIGSMLSPFYQRRKGTSTC